MGKTSGQPQEEVFLLVFAVSHKGIIPWSYLVDLMDDLIHGWRKSLRHDAETVQLGPIIRGITFVGSSDRQTSVFHACSKSCSPKMPAIPLSLPLMTFSYVPRSSMASNAHLLRLPHQLGQLRAIVEKHCMGIFCPKSAAG
jgi:hypothetical protein